VTWRFSNGSRPNYRLALVRAPETTPGLDGSSRCTVAAAAVFQVGPLQVHWYGIIIASAVLVAALLGGRVAKWLGEDPATGWSINYMSTICDMWHFPKCPGWS
jgi:hypothetical protein